jgi:division protein CdvB (Snf7/Vps24/ESCRT-III family)
VYFGLSFLALLISGYVNVFTVVMPVEPGINVWFITLSTYILINVMVVSSAYFIYLGMLKAESELKRSSTFISNLELIQQIEEMDQIVNKISKEYSVILGTITEQVDLALGETENIRLVNNLNNIRESTKEAKELSKNILSKIPERNLY